MCCTLYQFKHKVNYNCNHMLRVDIRESNLIQLLQQEISTPTSPYKDITLTTEPLELGDIIICNKLLVERKSVADLYASIIDNRYEEQGYRLTHFNHPNHNIMYLIEGDVMRHKQKQMLTSAIASINFFKGFSVYRTNNIQETCYFLLNTAKKLNKEMKEGKNGYYEKAIITEMEQHITAMPSISTNNDSKEEPESNIEQKLENQTQNIVEILPTEKDYVSVVKSCKKENITENNIDEIMLCQIPSISSQTAISIIKHFGSLKEMIKQYELHGVEILNGIKVSNSKGKETKLNKTVTKNLCRFLFKQ
jgi:ERCC4-type nuclease